ncbi:hypothetical protein BASA62_001142 [Batrachochytrium salamandrivorans]|nr:hypothetical protein BASA62_001142 [Batrachochytrium salamandrivorans]
MSSSMAATGIAASQRILFYAYEKQSLHLLCISSNAMGNTPSTLISSHVHLHPPTRTISIRATREAAATLKDHQAKDTPKPNPERRLPSEFTPSVYLRPSTIPLNAQRICGVLVRALVEGNHIIALEQYYKLVAIRQLDALSIDELQNLFWLLVTHQKLNPDPKVVAELDMLMGTLLNRASADHVRYGGLSMLPPSMFASLMYCHAKLQETDAIERIWEYLLTHGVSVNISIVNIVLECYAAVGNVEKANALLRKCADKNIAKADLRSFVALIDAYANAGQPMSSIQVLERTVQENIPLNIRLFNHVITGLAKDGKMQEINKVLNLMQERKFLPSTVTYNNIIHGCVVAGDYKRATQIFHEMIDDASSSAERNDQCGPDTATFNILMDIFSKQGDYQNSSKMLDEMFKRGVQPTVISFNTVMDACRRAGNLELMQEHFENISKYGLRPSSASYNTLISGYGFNGQMSVAQKLFDQMSLDGVPPSQITFSIMISLNGVYNRYDECLEHFKNMRARGIQPSKYILMQMMQVAIRTRATTAEVRGFFDIARRLNLVTVDLCHLLLLSHLLDDQTSLHEAVEKVYVTEMKPRSMATSIRTLDMVLDSIMRPRELVDKYTRHRSSKDKAHVNPSAESEIKDTEDNDIDSVDPFDPCPTADGTALGVPSFIASGYQAGDDVMADRDERALMSLMKDLVDAGNEIVQKKFYRTKLADAISAIRL